MAAACGQAVGQGCAPENGKGGKRPGVSASACGKRQAAASRKKPISWGKS